MARSPKKRSSVRAPDHAVRPRVEGSKRHARLRTAGVIAVIGGLLGWGVYELIDQDRAAAMGAREGLSVILISVDTLRADALSSYGSAVPTPRIDSLVDGGTLFSQASAQAPLTLPSHTSLLSSTYPPANGVIDNGQIVGEDLLTLPEVLRNAGYETGAFVGGYVLDRQFGLAQGFDHYDSTFRPPDGPEIDPSSLKRLGSEVVDAAQAWLSAHTASPFFVFLHLFDLHTPDNLPEEVRKRYPGPRYEAELRYVDDVLGGFFRFLEASGLVDDCLIIFTADHGEGLGDHGESSHGYFLYQSTIRVPLIVRWPAGAAGYPQRVEEAVSLMDVAPTVLEMTKIERPTSFAGGSLLRSLSGGHEEHEIYSQTDYGFRHFGVASLESFRVGRYKLIAAPKPELYDLLADAQESTNVIRAKEEIAADLSARLKALRARFSKAPNEVESHARSEADARLRSLGYLSGGSTETEGRPIVDPKDRIEAYERFRRAATLVTLGSMAEAGALLREVLATAPELPNVWRMLGLTHEKQGRFADALETYSRALDLDPGDALAHYSSGLCQVRLGRLEKASKEFAAAIAIAEDEGGSQDVAVSALEALGALRLETRQFEQAEEVFRDLLEKSPNNFDANFNLAWLAAGAGRLAEAVELLEGAVATRPDDPAARNALGGLYLRAGDLTAAEREFDRAVALDPALATAHFNLGLVHRKKSDFAAAREHFRAALAADPGLQAAREALAATPERRP